MEFSSEMFTVIHKSNATFIKSLKTEISRFKTTYCLLLTLYNFFGSELIVFFLSHSFSTYWTNMLFIFQCDINLKSHSTDLRRIGHNIQAKILHEPDNCNKDCGKSLCQSSLFSFLYAFFPHGKLGMVVVPLSVKSYLYKTTTLSHYFKREVIIGVIFTRNSFWFHGKYSSFYDWNSCYATPRY